MIATVRSSAGSHAANTSPIPPPPIGRSTWYWAIRGDCTSANICRRSRASRTEASSTSALGGSLGGSERVAWVEGDIATGLEDPNVSRAEERVEAKLQDKELTAEERKRLELERKRLREKLLGLNKKPARAANPQRATKVERVEESRGIGNEGESNLTDSQRKMAMSVFGDKRKRKASVKLVPPDEIRMPNLPDGLSPEALYEVLQSNSASIGMCIAESSRANERLKGRMEVQIEIATTGSVNSVSIVTGVHQGTKMASCTQKRIRTWKFPRFNGTPLNVVMPFVLSQGL